MTSQHVEKAFLKADELTVRASQFMPPNTDYAAVFNMVFNALLHCDDDAEPKSEQAKGASA